MQINVFLLFGLVILIFIFFLRLNIIFLNVLIISIVIGLRNFFNVNEKKVMNNKDNNSKKNEYDLIIVGAGLSGLTAAHEANKLTNNSLKILLLEVSPNYGGNSINEIDGINHCIL